MTEAESLVITPSGHGVLTPFHFESQEVRIIARDGEPWFVATDVCRVLGLVNNRDAIEKLDTDEKGVAFSDTLGGQQEFSVINEGGLYTLVLRCRGATTPGTVQHRFRKWVTAEVLPSIRKTGGYGVPADPMIALGDPMALRGLLLTYTEKVLALEAANAELTPKAEALDRLATADGSLCITDAAKALQVRPKDLFSYLREHGWIYKRPGATHYLGYQTRTTSGDLEHKVTTVLRADGSEKVIEQVLVTTRGLTKLAKLLSPSVRAVA